MAINKQSIKTFFLYHAEKLILALSMVLLGLFFWMGYSSEVFNAKTPKQLVSLADQADTYITRPTAWVEIEKLRNAESPNIDDANLDSEQYPFGIFTPKVKSQEKRSDPRLFKPSDLMAFQVYAPVILTPTPPKAGARTVQVADPLVDFPLAMESTARGRGMEEMEMGMDDEMFGGFGDPRDRRRGGADKKEVETEEVVVDAGASVSAINEFTFPGIRPRHFKIVPTTNKSFILNVVGVTAVVNVKQQWAEYERSFASGAGFYPQRDRPVYQFLQVERTKVVDGEPEEWQDISNDIDYRQPRLHPRTLVKMPMAMFPSAPETIDADFYDPILTKPIPPISQVDYRPMATHPKIRNRVFDQFDDSLGDPIEIDRKGMFEAGADDPIRRGIGGRMRGGMGMGMEDGFGGRGVMERQKVAVRAGSNTIKYKEAITARKALDDYKLVRFFDLQAQAGVTYRYRVRVWLGDPNHEDEEKLFEKMFGREGMAGGRGGGEMDMMEFEGMDEGLDGQSVGRDGRTPVKQYEYVAITHGLITNPVRVRLDGAGKEKSADGKRIYFVSEPRKAEDGSEANEKVYVPVGREYLRYARPTQWSDPVDITIAPRESQVVASKTEHPRMLRVNNQQIPDGEPVVEVAAMSWSRKYGTALPARRKVQRGDALDFKADIHVLNAVDWNVHVYQNAPIITGGVVVDVLGGEEIPLSRDEQMRHHLPTEVLVMDADGSFHVTNDMADKTRFMQLLLQSDDSSIVGGDKARRRLEKEREKDERAGGGGMFEPF